MRDAEAVYAVARGAPVEPFLATAAGRALAAAARDLGVDPADWAHVLRDLAREGDPEEIDRLVVEASVLTHDDLLWRLLEEDDLEIDLVAASTMVSLCCGSAQGDGCCGGGMTCHDGGGCSNPAERLEDGAVVTERPCGDRCSDCGHCS